MSTLRITGGVPLAGTVAVSGAKNAALPIMAATLLVDGPVSLARVPRLTDVETMAQLLSVLGMRVAWREDGCFQLETADPRPVTAPFELVGRMRASFCVLGPLLACRGRAIVALPGGCRIGRRPVDIHLRSLAALGADIRIQRGCVIATAQRLRGAWIDLSGPRGGTVTGTANTMMAACLARGTTVISGAACEPEIVDLGNFLNQRGADIGGLGGPTLQVRGVDQLTGGAYEIIPDRIEAATLLLAAAVTGGSVTLSDVAPGHLPRLLPALQAAGCRLRVRDERIAIVASGRPRPVDVVARPYPGLATDVQPQWTTLMTLAAGRGTVRDDVFPERFAHLEQLRRFGAQVRRCGSTAVVHGRPRLFGADVVATDLRAGAALVLAGLAAEGETRLRGVEHLDRGYERLDAKLARLGANIQRLPSHDYPIRAENGGNRTARESMFVG